MFLLVPPLQDKSFEHSEHFALFDSTDFSKYFHTSYFALGGLTLALALVLALLVSSISTV